MNAITQWAEKLAHAHPAFATRARRAGELVTGGHVAPNGHPHHYYVRSQSRPSVTYVVGIPPGDLSGWTCTCPDFTLDHAPDVAVGSEKRRRCKHMGAAFIYAQLHKESGPPGVQSSGPEGVRVRFRVHVEAHYTTEPRATQDRIAILLGARYVPR